MMIVVNMDTIKLKVHFTLRDTLSMKSQAVYVKLYFGTLSFPLINTISSDSMGYYGILLIFASAKVLESINVQLWNCFD